MDARNLLRRFKNIGNYLRLLSDADVYGLCKLYPVTRGGGWLSPLHDHPLSFICVHRVAKSYCSNDSTFFSFFFLIFYVRWDRGRSINSTMNIQRVVRLFPLEKQFDYTKCRVIGTSKRYTYVYLLQGRLSLSSIINIYMILSLSYIVHFVLSNKKLVRFNSSADITQ